jgi:hypothetical protein
MILGRRVTRRNSRRSVVTVIMTMMMVVVIAIVERMMIIQFHFTIVTQSQSRHFPGIGMRRASRSTRFMRMNGTDFVFIVVNRNNGVVVVMMTSVVIIGSGISFVRGFLMNRKRRFLTLRGEMTEDLHRSERMRRRNRRAVQMILSSGGRCSESQNSQSGGTGGHRKSSKELQFCVCSLLLRERKNQ